MYHRICRDNVEKGSKFVVNASVFREQLRYFAEAGYQTPKLADMVGGSNGRPKSVDKPLLITFDDGYLDTYDNAFPALKDFGFTAIVFAVADFTRRTNWWDTPKHISEAPLMEPQHMIEMGKHGIEFGSHGWNHRSLPLLSNDELEIELRRSKRMMEDVLGQQVPSFAYPYGELNERVKVATISSGYTCAFASNSGPLNFYTDLFEIRRVLISNSSNALYLRTKLFGIQKTLKWGAWMCKKVIGKQPAYTL